MLSITTHRYLRMLLELALFALATLALLLLLSVAQAQRAARPAPRVEPPDATAQAPAMNEYRGVRLAMTAAEVRQKLGTPDSSDGRQDVFKVNDKETAQVFYDRQGKAIAVTINYFGDPSAPTPERVFGAPAETREDGSVYKMVRYEAAGFWVVYTSTADEPRLVTVAIQKIL